MQCPDCIRSLGSAANGSVLLQHMRVWFASVRPERDPPAIVPRRPAIRVGRTRRAKTAVLLAFPIHGEALLVRLATLLDARIRKDRSGRNPLELTIERDPYSRLIIDGSAHVEYDPGRSQYRAEIEASADTRVILETTDFDALVEFVVRYVAARLSEISPLEVAS